MVKQNISGKTMQAYRILLGMSNDLDSIDPLTLKIRLWNYVYNGMPIKEMADAACYGVDFNLVSTMLSKHNAK